MLSTAISSIKTNVNVSLGVLLVSLIIHIFEADLFPRLACARRSDHVNCETCRMNVKKLVLKGAAPQVSLAVDFLDHWQDPTSDNEILKIKNLRS